MQQKQQQHRPRAMVAAMRAFHFVRKSMKTRDELVDPRLEMWSTGSILHAEESRNRTQHNGGLQETQTRACAAETKRGNCSWGNRDTILLETAPENSRFSLSCVQCQNEENTKGSIKLKAWEICTGKSYVSGKATSPALLKQRSNALLHSQTTLNFQDSY